jgi:hypothetical protein
VVSVSIVKQKNKGGEANVESRGFGFVKFASAPSAKKAADKTGHRVESRSVTVMVHLETATEIAPVKWTR